MIFKRKFNIAVLGSNGMLGAAVLKKLEAESMNKRSIVNKVLGFTREQVQFPYRVDDCLGESKLFDVVVNCIAFTDTARCEDPNFFKQSYEANVLGVKTLAEYCAHKRIKLVHISTDYIYSEMSTSKEENHPGRHHAVPFPCNMYGLQKLLGEKYVETAYARFPKDFLTLRVSWLYGISKKPTFVHKILANAYKKLAQKDSAIFTPALNVVSDCFGSPTNVTSLADFIYDCLVEKMFGAIEVWKHLDMSRLDFAKHILKFWTEDVDPILNDVVLSPITSHDAGGAVHQPMFLDTLHYSGGFSSTNYPLYRFPADKNVQKLSQAYTMVCKIVDKQVQDIHAYIKQNKDLIMQQVNDMLDSNTKEVLESLRMQQ